MPSNKATSKRTSRHRTTRGRIGRRGLRLEFLEDRRLLSADGLTAQHLAPSLDWRLDAGGDELAAVYDVSDASDASDALLHLPVLLGEDNDGPQFVPGEVLIGFDGHWQALHRGRGSEAALEVKAELFSSMGLSHPNMLVPFQESGPGNRPIETRWQFPADTDVQQMVQSLANIPGVTYAEPNYLVSIGSIPNDSRFDTLWGLHNTGQNGGTAGADIQALDAWELSVGTTSTVVGVIDTGIDYTHPDLLFNIWIHQDEIPPDLRDQLHDVEGDGRITFRDLNSPVNAAFVQDMNGNGVIDPYDLLNDSRWVTGTDTAGNGFIDDLFGWNFVSNTNDPFDDNGHGTHVAGTIGALGNNSGGVAGVNWNVKLMGLKFLGAGGGGTTANAVAAVNYATLMANRGENIRLTNNSWGGGAFSEALQNAIAASGEADMLFVAAAGNSGRDTDETPYFPASYDLDNVITVAATDRNDQLAWFSNYGSGSVHLGAPGVHIMSTSHGGTYRSLNGTSMAAPHVAGVAALAWSHAPDANYQEIRDAMLAGVDPVEALEGITLSGGRLNARSTLDAFPSDVGDTLATARPTRLVSPAPGDYYITSNVEIGDGQFGDLDVDVYQLRGIPGSSFTALTRQPPGADPMNTVLRLFDAQGTEVASESGNGYAQLAYTFDTASPYFIAVSGAGNTAYDPAVEGSGSPGQTGHYQLQMGFDVGDTLATAAPTGIVELGDRFVQPNTRLGDGPFGEKDVDLYKLDAIPNSRLTVATSQPFGEEPTSTVLRLFDAEGNELLIDSPVSGYASLEYTFQEAGTYYLGVSGSGNDQYDPHVGGSGSAGDTGHYRLDVSVDIKLEFSRYFGGTGHEDSIMATAVAGHGGVLVTGWTDSVDLPEALNSHHGGTYDAFVANMGPDGTVLWSTYVGGSDWDWAEWIAVDADDNVYVLGITYSNDLPKSTNSSPGGSQNAFAAKLDASGELMWTTYVGGSAFDSGNGIAIDSNNNVLIGGYTSSQDLPNAINEYHGGTRDHFVAKLGNDGSFKWSMYLGGSDVESVGGLAVDHHDNIIFFGSTLSEDLPGAGNSYPGGARSGYLAKIVLDGGGQPSLAWTTYWGGSGTDSLTALAIDQHNNFLITGQTRSTDLPEATNGYLSYSGTPFQAFVAKLNGEDGSAMWTTYLGGATGRSESRGVAVDDWDNVFAAGFILGSRDYRAATNRPPGSDSASLVRLDAETGEATWMLYLGGSGWDEASAVAIGPEGQVYVSGYTASPDFTGTSNPFAGTYNAFLLKLDPESVPTPPVSVYNDSYSAVSGELLVADAAMGVLANDVLPPGTNVESLTVELVGTPLRGQVQLADDGSFVYTPPPHYFGNDVFRYRVFDGVRYSRIAEVFIEIEGSHVFHSTDTPMSIRGAHPNRPRQTDSELTISATDLHVGALLLDLSISHNQPTDLSADLVSPAGTRVELFHRVSNIPTTYDLSSTFFGEPLDGTWTLEIWDHERWWTGTLEGWSLTVAALVENSPPVAADDSYSVDWNTVLVVEAPGVLANDFDPDGDPLTAVLVSGPSDGALALQSDGSFVYTPDPGFHGTDSFTYMANDGLANSNAATVTLTVVAPNLPPEAEDNQYTVSWNRPLEVAAPGVLANDSDPNGDPLTAVLVDGSGPDYGTLQFNQDGSFTYTPHEGFVGSDSFSYQAFDGQLYSEPALVTIDVINQAPVALDISFSTSFETPLIVDAPGVLENDSDPDGDLLTAVLVDGPSSGDLVFHEDGSFTYTPETGFDGQVTFTYQASDGNKVSNLATVTIIVGAPNLPPEAQDNFFDVTWNQTLVVAAPGVLANDSDPNGDSLTAVLVDESGPGNGTLQFNQDGSFTYTPDEGFVGSDSFSYRAFDGQLYSEPATVTITVGPDVSEETFTSADTPMPINTATRQSPGITQSILAIDQAMTIETLVVDVSLSFSRNVDLSGHLIGPDGTRVDLFDRVETIPTSFDVSSSFQGKQLDGNWVLELVDHHHRPSSGTLSGWSLTVTGTAGNLGEAFDAAVYGLNGEASPSLSAGDAPERLGSDTQAPQTSRNLSDGTSAPPPVPGWNVREKSTPAMVDHLVAADSQDLQGGPLLDEIEDILEELLGSLGDR